MNEKREDSRKRPLLVNFRVTAAERDHLHRMARSRGLSLGNLIRLSLGMEQVRTGRGGGD